MYYPHSQLEEIQTKMDRKWAKNWSSIRLKRPVVSISASGSLQVAFPRSHFWGWLYLTPSSTIHLKGQSVPPGDTTWRELVTCWKVTVLQRDFWHRSFPVLWKAPGKLEGWPTRNLRKLKAQPGAGSQWQPCGEGAGSLWARKRARGRSIPSPCWRPTMSWVRV